MKYEITEETANKILNFLATCPYGQVHILVKELQAIKPIPEIKPENKDGAA